MPTQAAVCSIPIAPRKPPDHVDPIKRQGSPVNAWPRTHSATVQVIANRKIRAVLGNRRRLVARLTRRTGGPVERGNGAGSARAAIGTSHQKVAMSTKRAAAIQ